MISKKEDSARILERLMSSYGVNTQKELANCLGIPANNISGWTQRGRVPGNAIIKCALDTGADLKWLSGGELAKANSTEPDFSRKGAALYGEIMSNGGRPVLRRIMDAYGFTLQKQLCDLLNISSGTVSTWIRRGYFPGDVVITCALDTGVSLEWLATGQTKRSNTVRDDDNRAVFVPKFRLEGGRLIEDGLWATDISLFQTGSEKIIYVEGVTRSWLINDQKEEIGNGRWVVNIDNSYDVFDLFRLPGNRLTISNEKISLECKAEEISIFGMVLFTIERHV